jgi:hypothetical protein
MKFMIVCALVLDPFVNPSKLFGSLAGRVLLFEKSLMPAVPGAVVPNAPIVAEAYVVVPTKSTVPGLSTSLLLSRNSPLNRKA